MAIAPAKNQAPGAGLMRDYRIEATGTFRHPLFCCLLQLFGLHMHWQDFTEWH
jgi:hypothetical protein